MENGVDTCWLFDTEHRSKAIIVLIVCLAILASALVAWMFASSQVIAPIPI
jgi:uncharacterized membrane protein YqjE